MYVVLKGILDETEARGGDFDKDAGGAVYIQGVYGKMVKIDQDVPQSDWVPGSAGHFTAPGGTGLYGGEWVVYVGKDLFWGLGGGVKKLSDWIRIMSEWPGVTGTPTDDGERQYPKMGLASSP